MLRFLSNSFGCFALLKLGLVQLSRYHEWMLSLLSSNKEEAGLSFEPSDVEKMYASNQIKF